MKKTIRFIVLLLLEIGLGACSEFPKPLFFPQSIAGDIASGLLRFEEGYDILRAQSRVGFNQPTCKSPTTQYIGTIAPFWSCIAVGNEYSQCSILDGDDCVSVKAAAFLLEDQERFAKVWDAMNRPCKYLPSPREIATNTEIRPNDRSVLELMWQRARCDTDHDGYKGKVILTLFEWETPIKTFIKPAQQ